MFPIFNPKITKLPKNKTNNNTHTYEFNKNCVTFVFWINEAKIKHTKNVYSLTRDLPLWIMIKQSVYYAQWTWRNWMKSGNGKVLLNARESEYLEMLWILFKS